MDKVDKIVKESINNFLKDYRKDTANNAKLVSINEINAKTMIAKHSSDGYIVISPCRGYNDFKDQIDASKSPKEQLSAINKKRVIDMINRIKESGYSYTPVYGGFIENKGSEDEENVYERSFIIYNRDKKGNVGDFNDLNKFGIELAKAFNQDSFLSKSPQGKPMYITQNGKVDMEFSGNLSFNDLSQDYFTDLHKNTDKYKDMGKRAPTRFSFTECYINPYSQCLSEAYTRFLKNEVALPYKSDY